MIVKALTLRTIRKNICIFDLYYDAKWLHMASLLLLRFLIFRLKNLLNALLCSMLSESKEKMNWTYNPVFQ